LDKDKLKGLQRKDVETELVDQEAKEKSINGSKAGPIDSTILSSKILPI